MYDFYFWEFSFFKCYPQIKNGFLQNWIPLQKDPDPTGSGLEKLWQFTLFLQITHSFKVIKTKFLKRISKENSSWFIRGYITILKPRSIVLLCRVSVSPILAHSGSWWLDTKIVKKLGEGQEHFKKRSRLQQSPSVIWATSQFRGHMNSLGSNGFSGILWHLGIERWFKKGTPYEFSLCFNKHSIGKMALCPKNSGEWF